MKIISIWSMGFSFLLMGAGSSGFCARSSQSTTRPTTRLQAHDVTRLKEEILAISQQTNRGFQASSQDRQKVKDIVMKLSTSNPTPEPARGYYADASEDDGGPSLCGRWTLVYTDAPDITGLDNGVNPLVELGRIGQECEPPFIRNVIEWKRPSWMPSIPYVSGTQPNRILQRVVTKASSTPGNPKVVDLEIAGVQLSTDGTAEVSDLASVAQTDGLLPGLLKVFPVDAQGPISLTFGQFTVLYLDDGFRVVRTGQGYIAINEKTGNEWI